MPNRLARETSPYLRMHAENPVDWYPWGEEALSLARSLDKPILLSIGYSACHWCHVMERESFEDEETAKLMNDGFVCIKVDREERPDIDRIYQVGVQLLTRHGGWPLTVFCCPDGRPFFGGTYFPPTDRHGMPGFPTVLRVVAEQYRSRRGAVETNARLLAEGIREVTTIPPGRAEPTAEKIAEATRRLAAGVDRTHGGFGTRPKFPNAGAVSLLLREHAHSGDEEVKGLVLLSLDGMMRGGIHDQIGGGFHRYSVDQRWLVPHFEKMLYDNALLARLFLDGWRATGNDAYARTVRETLDYLTREMQSPEGGFYSAQDADSEDEEGKFFVWRPEEIVEIVGPGDADVAMRVWGVTEDGNFEGGSTVLSVCETIEEVARATGRGVAEVDSALARARAALARARERRVRPFRDEKILACWNGLAIGAMADAGAALGEPRFIESASSAARFIVERMLVGGRLCRTFHEGVAKIDAYLEDVAFVASGMLDLYEATFDESWLVQARSLLDDALVRFRDPETGTLFLASRDHEKLFHRVRDQVDDVTPSGSSAAAEALLRLADLAGEERHRAAAEQLVRASFGVALENPFGFPYLLGAADRLVRGSNVIALAGEPGDERLRALHRVVARSPVPNRVVLLVGREDEMGRLPVAEKPAAYFCRGRSCSPPILDPEALAGTLCSPG